jgi:ubiquinone/menaquinone biosynthesis C-methylase UbiE
MVIKIIKLLGSIRIRMMRVFFYQLYHKFSWTYDVISSIVSLGNWEEWILSVVPYLSGSRVLELGHGPGHLLYKLCEAGIKVYGIDESPTMGVISQKRLNKWKRFPGLIRAYAQSIPFPNQTYHQIVATFPSEFITDPRTINEAFRVLHHGGKFIILPFAWINGKTVLERVAAWLFQVTGQAPEWSDKILAPFFKAGFRPTIREVKGYNWSLLIIIAEKPLQKPFHPH